MDEQTLEEQTLDEDEEQILVEKRLIIAEPSEDGEEEGYSWTLNSALGEMLLFAEEQFGPRDYSYTILGIEFSPDGPQLLCPGHGKHIIIQLSMDCLTDRQEAYYDLSHECAHLLSPTGEADVNVLEEGIAAYFGLWYTRYVFGDGWWDVIYDQPYYSPIVRPYAEALSYAQELLKHDPDVIKKLRQHEPTIARITADLIVQVCPTFPVEIAQKLAQPFRHFDSEDENSEL